MEKDDFNQWTSSNPMPRRRRVQRIVEEAKAANNVQPAMAKVDPPAVVRLHLIAEERLAIAIQGIRQPLGELQAQPATYEISHDTPTDDVQPMNDEQTELGDRSRDVTVAHEDSRSDLMSKITTGGQREGEDASHEVPSNRRTPVQVPDNAVVKIVPRREQPRGEAHGRRTPDADRLAPTSAGNASTGELGMRSSGKKGPPWLPDLLTTETHPQANLPGTASLETHRGLEAWLADKEEIARLITKNKDLMKEVEELERKEAKLKKRLDEVSTDSAEMTEGILARI